MALCATSDENQGQVLAAVLWDTTLRTEQIAIRAKLDTITTRNALEDLLRRGMVTVDDRGDWTKSELPPG